MNKLIELLTSKMVENSDVNINGVLIPSGININMVYVNDNWHMFTRSELRVNESKLGGNVQLFEEFKNILT